MIFTNSMIFGEMSSLWAFSAPMSGGEATESSGFDLLVELDDPKMGLLSLIALENYLSDLLGVKVDLVEKQTLKPSLSRHVLAEAEEL